MQKQAKRGQIGTKLLKSPENQSVHCTSFLVIPLHIISSQSAAHHLRSVRCTLSPVSPLHIISDQSTAHHPESVHCTSAKGFFKRQISSHSTAHPLNALSTLTNLDLMAEAIHAG